MHVADVAYCDAVSHALNEKHDAAHRLRLEMIEDYLFCSNAGDGHKQVCQCRMSCLVDASRVCGGKGCASWRPECGETFDGKDTAFFDFSSGDWGPR